MKQAWTTNYDNKGSFDMVFAHYVVMGGFAVHIEHLHNSITRRVTVTPEGVLFLAQSPPQNSHPSRHHQDSTMAHSNSHSKDSEQAALHLPHSLWRAE